MSKPETMNQFYLQIIEQRSTTYPRINAITKARALHWGIVGALLSVERPGEFNTDLLDAVISHYQGAVINTVATNGTGQIQIDDYSWRIGTGPTPYIGFENSDLYFGLTPERLPDFNIASVNS